MLILPTSVCSSETAVRISQQIPNSIPLPHQHGCCHMGEDYKQVLRTLIGFGKNPNVGAVLIVALGCEGIQPEEVKKEIETTLKPVEQIVIQKSGGTLKTIEKGTKIAKKMMVDLSLQEKIERGPIKTEEAIEAHEKLADLYPWWSYYLGITYYKTGQQEKAEKMLNDLLDWINRHE